jgi:hypothetical protein
MLYPDDKPIKMLVKFLQSIGYSLNDQIEKLGFEDHSYYFRFVFREINYNQRASAELEQQVPKIAYINIS